MYDCVSNLYSSSHVETCKLNNVVEQKQKLFSIYIHIVNKTVWMYIVSVSTFIAV